MYCELFDDQKDTFLEVSESGMGYQHIAVNNQEYIVLNKEYMFDWDEYFSGSRYSILTFEKLKEAQGRGDHIGFNAAIINLVPNPLAPAVSLVGTSVMAPYIYYTQTNDVFYRLSAFAADRCIISPTELRPNSYTISNSDKTHVSSGLAAVARYALPSRLPHIYVWKIEPPINTMTYVGTVIPNYGMCGGGVEIYFPNGFTGGIITLQNNLLVM